MGKASKELLGELETIVNAAASRLPKTTTKRMFGCHGLFADNSVFGLVWKEGRIGVRLPNGAQFQKLMSQKGSAPWKAGKMTMSHWVLVPTAMHTKKKDLSHWLEAAHSLALLAEKKAPAKAKKAPLPRKASARSEAHPA
jgi:TfoX/Sxy family transcriptional regulator of competence genes